MPTKFCSCYKICYSSAEPVCEMWKLQLCRVLQLFWNVTYNNSKYIYKYLISYIYSVSIHLNI